MSEPRMDTFLRLSAEVTGFRVVELRGTGQSEAYLETADRVVGPEAVDQLLAAFVGLGASTEDKREQRLRREIFGSERLGPIARNLIKLWYVGVWYQLPRAWREKWGAREHDVTHTVSASAYTEGLLWPAIGANPAGAKAPGYASWTEKPKLPVI